MTKNQYITLCKSENPKMIQTINGVERELSKEEYEEAAIAWAEMKVEQDKAEAL
jgi:hypothetical protein